MSRYIETEYIGRTINHLPIRYVQAERDETAIDIVVSKIDVVKAIVSAPSIEIVRCKECKHGTYCEEAEMYICNANDQDLYEAEHFCSYGERRSE